MLIRDEYTVYTETSRKGKEVNAPIRRIILDRRKTITIIGASCAGVEAGEPCIPRTMPDATFLLLLSCQTVRFLTKTGSHRMCTLHAHSRKRMDVRFVRETQQPGEIYSSEGLSFL